MTFDGMPSVIFLPMSEPTQGAFKQLAQRNEKARPNQEQYQHGA
jgi:hypothetical protein